MRPTHTVFITAHYLPPRLPFLRTVLDAVAAWPDCTVDVRLVTNDRDLREEELVREQARRFREAGSALRCLVVDDLDHPFLLTWHHKRHLDGWTRTAGEGDLFVYLEDDTVLTAAGIEYFQEYRAVLGGLGLIPGYLRFEQLPGGPARAVDLVRPELVGHRNTARVGDVTAHVCANPYWAGFILDRELAEEYLGSRSFDIEASRFIGWDVRARAAIGPCFERVPAGFSARNAVVLSEGRPLEGALVWHCANTYASIDHPHYGRLAVADAFRSGSSLASRLHRARARLDDLRIAARQRSGA